MTTLKLSSLHAPQKIILMVAIIYNIYNTVFALFIFYKIQTRQTGNPEKLFRSQMLFL
jgi:hypothetical protein